MRSALISTKPFIFDLFLVGVTVQSAESLSPAIPLGTSTKRANSKRANHGRSRLFQDAVSSVSSWLRSFSVCGWRTRSLSSVSGHSAHSPRDSPSLAHSSEEGPPFSGARHHLAPASRPVEPPCVAPGQDAADLSGLPQAVVETITQARAPSTRQAYALKWNLFANWCSSHREDPRRCTIGVVLSFLQERLERRLSPSTLKVYVAAIAAHHDAVDGRSLGKHDLIVRFLRGARRLNPSRPPLMSSWDLSIVLAGLQRGPFEPLDSVELKYLSAKTALLTALTSIKRVGDLQAFSVSEECLVFGPDYCHVVLRPRPGYVPKVPTTPFRDQVVNLQALPLEEADPALELLCPIRALRIYSGAKKYLVSHQLCKFSHLKRWERPVIFIIGIPQLWETK